MADGEVVVAAKGLGACGAGGGNALFLGGALGSPLRWGDGSRALGFGVGDVGGGIVEVGGDVVGVGGSIGEGEEVRVAPEEVRLWVFGEGDYGAVLEAGAFAKGLGSCLRGSVSSWARDRGSRVTAYGTLLRA